MGFTQATVVGVDERVHPGYRVEGRVPKGHVGQGRVVKFGRGDSTLGDGQQPSCGINSNDLCTPLRIVAQSETRSAPNVENLHARTDVKGYSELLVQRK